MNPTWWDLLDALALLRPLQAVMAPMGYHICLGGGVLNTGQSWKDLDLYFLPLTNAQRPDLDPLVAWLKTNWGVEQPCMTDAQPCVSLRYQASFLVGAKRIDVFVV